MARSRPSHILNRRPYRETDSQPALVARQCPSLELESNHERKRKEERTEVAVCCSCMVVMLLLQIERGVVLWVCSRLRNSGIMVLREQVSVFVRIIFSPICSWQQRLDILSINSGHGYEKQARALLLRNVRLRITSLPCTSTQKSCAEKSPYRNNSIQ